MDFGKNFSYVTEDEAWIKKVLIAGLPLLVPCLNIVWMFAVVGFLKKLFLNVVAGEERPIPEWDDFGGYIMSGLKSIVVPIGYMAPFFVLMILSYGTSFALAIMKVPGLAILPMICMWCISFPIGLLINIMLPVGLMRYWTTDSYGEAFKFGAVIGFVKANLGSYLISWVIHLLAGICFIFPYGYFVAWKCFGDLWRGQGETSEA
ncbi:MAG: DUF4013 domain-containing protein [Acidobacteriota bacterium]